MQLELKSSPLGGIDVNKPSAPVELQSYWCRIVRTDREMWYPKPHSHSFWELHVCLQGVCTIQVNDECVVLKPNCFLFLCPGTVHTIVNEEQDFVKLVWGFDFHTPDVSEVLMQEYSRIRPETVSGEMLAALRQVLENAECDGFGAYDLVKNGLYHMFVCLVREGRKLSGGISRKESSEDLRLICRYLSEHPGTTAEEIAALFYISKSKLERMCKAEYGISFHRLCQSIRTERIRSLLRETNLTMDQIASMVGFADRYAMGKFFKKQEGTPPGNYRKAVQRR